MTTVRTSSNGGRGKHGTSGHHGFGQQNGQRNVAPTLTTLQDAYSPAASSLSSPANISIFSSQLHRVLQSSTPARISIFFKVCSSWSTSTSTTGGASSSAPEASGYSFIAKSSNDNTIKPIHFSLMTNNQSINNQLLEGACFRWVWCISCKEG